jgi:tRNA 2-thiouridine synthesizing protein A
MWQWKPCWGVGVLPHQLAVWMEIGEGCPLLDGRAANGALHTDGACPLSVVEATQLSPVRVVAPTHRLNVIGFFCPVPVAEAKKALNIMDAGQVLELLADDPETLHDLPMLLNRTGHRLLSIDESAGEYSFLIEVAV